MKMYTRAQHARDLIATQHTLRMYSSHTLHASSMALGMEASSLCLVVDYYCSSQLPMAVIWIKVS